MSLETLIFAVSQGAFAAAIPEASSSLESIFPDTLWGFDFKCDEYSPQNIQNIWTNELRSAVRRSLEDAGKDIAAYREFLGKVHFATVAIYPKRLFAGEYKSNVGWRLLILGVPAARVMAVGIASHYQGGQRHNQLALASNLLYDFARDVLAGANDGLELPGRKVEPDDWDKVGLIASPITEIAGVDISRRAPEGIHLKDVRTTTVKKILASFIDISSVTPDQLTNTLSILQRSGTALATRFHPFCDLAEFEQIRSLALEDLAAARTRIELRRKSATRSIVRVYFGPPGTGKTLAAVKEAVELADPLFTQRDDLEAVFARFNEIHGQVAFITFHPSLQYEDVVESIRPEITKPDKDSPLGAMDIGGAPGETESSGGPGDTMLRYSLHEGPILKMIRRAAENPAQEHVLVIDEINRGDLSRILGPLISAIEPEKRAGAEFPVGFESQYARAPELESRIFMPSNLHILGTMNSADRNIALVDYALRRRFDFVQCPPREELLKPTNDNPILDLPLLLRVLNQRIRNLLDADHCIGHSYFMGCEKNQDVVSSFARRVLPLLTEYFFGNEAHLLLVVGDRVGGTNNIFRIERSQETFLDLFGIDLESALEMGYRERELHMSLSLESRFWNPHKLVPGPDDEPYAVAALKKLYAPAASPS